jgi:hypothetical protein
MIPHTISFFRRNKHFNIEPLFCVVEQADSVEFNQGALKNQGFLAVKNSVDCVCFHDVDYLPMWADYSEPNLPTRIIWWGLHERPIGHGTTHSVTAQRHGLAAVAVMKKWHFEQANGYSNQYWGWGYEDTDLTDRLSKIGLPPDYRDGTFQPLDHDSLGYAAHEVPTPDHVKNKKTYESKKNSDHSQDGLNSPIGQIVSVQRQLVSGLDQTEIAPLWWVKVDLAKDYTVS